HPLRVSADKLAGGVNGFHGLPRLWSEKVKRETRKGFLVTESVDVFAGLCKGVWD
ncbi:unnamed protein product, partial [Dovyalis caffra]